MTENCTEHPHNTSQALARLERAGLLRSQGQYMGRGQHRPGARPIPPEQVFSGAGSSGSNESSSGSKARSEELPVYRTVANGKSE